jgi:hypothetical protein
MIIESVVADFVVVGGGPAGCVLTKSLSDAGKKVVLVDIGSINNINVKSKPPFINNSPQSYTPAFSGELGGNSALWAGKIYLLSESELCKGKWEIKYPELLEYSKVLASELNIDHEKLISISKKDGMLYHHSYRSNLKNIFDYLNINKLDNVTVYEKSSPVELVYHNSQSKVESVVISNSTGKKTVVKVKGSVIFSAGGLGNPHLLLNLLGDNSHENIGKFLSDHPHINIGKLSEKEYDKYSIIAKPYISNNKFELNQVVKIKSSFCGIQLDSRADITRLIKRIYLNTSSQLVRKSIFILEKIIAKNFDFFRKLLKNIGFSNNLYSFEHFFSQEKNKKNKVTLSNSRCKFNLKKIDIQWKIFDYDEMEYNQILRKCYGEDGVVYPNLSSFQPFEKTTVYTGLHPSCSTALSSEKSESVVDSNLKLCSHKNIYVCGSSVFPSVGFTNPTWTIMVLAKRLSKKLCDLHE